MRKSVGNIRRRILFFPFALIQWIFLTLIFGGIGGIVLIMLGVVFFITNFFLGEFEDMFDSLNLIGMPFYLTIRWWYDYFTKGEIGSYGLN